ncbi:hypothetical protein NPIL_120391 [Nephila pilipes]|uniref:Uncharacterized protein n=1 Tax=Nephila pilipes TaxID=299642 RepID=A0A8X6N2N7_NEPPI|nr:hypothetical protein NPIL_120391 [Nephila pilipes]
MPQIVDRDALSEFTDSRISIQSMQKTIRIRAIRGCPLFCTVVEGPKFHKILMYSNKLRSFGWLCVRWHDHRRRGYPLTWRFA